MRKKNSFLSRQFIPSLIFLCFASTFAQETSAPISKSCLWKVQSKANTVYLLGSIHLLQAENYPLPTAMEKAFDESRVLVLEINPDSLALPQMQQLVLGKGVFAAGKTLQSVLSKETLALAQKRAAEVGLDLVFIQNFEPWLVGITLTAAKLQLMGLTPQHGVDQYFFKKAQAANKPVLTLESIAFQINRFDLMSLKNQNDFLEETLQEWDVLESDLDRIVQAWSRGEPDTLATILFEGMKAYPEVYFSLITERNRNWLPRIEKFLLADKTHLVVVGAGHMVGPEGLIPALQSKGYFVQQL